MHTHSIPYSPFFAFGRAALCAVLLLCGLGGALSAQAAGNPLSAISTAQKAIDTNDTNLFYRAVDVDAILHKGTGDVLEILNQKMQQGELTGANPMLALALSGLNTKDPATTEILRSALTTEVKNFINTGISGGYFAGKPNGKVSSKSGAFGGLLKNISKERKELVPGKVLAQQGNTAKISAMLVDSDAGKFPLELGVVEKDGQWRINEVTNTRTLLNSAMK